MEKPAVARMRASSPITKPVSASVQTRIYQIRAASLQARLEALAAATGKEMAIADGEPMDTTMEKEAELNIPRGIRAGGQPEVPELANSADVGAFKAYEIGKIDQRPGEVERIPPNELDDMGDGCSLESGVATRQSLYWGRIWM